MKNLLLLLLFICSSSIIIAQDTLITSSSNNANSQDMYIRGYNDAIKYYKNYKAAGNSVLIASSLPFYGIMFGGASALLMSSAAPSDENLDYPDLSLMRNEAYAKGYKKSAKNIKRKKVITNFFTGLGIGIGLTVAISTSLDPN
jgi:hypothetical protein